MDKEQAILQDAPRAAELYREKAEPGARTAPDWGKTLVGALLLILGLVVLVRSMVLDGSLWILGERIPATVVALWAEPHGEVEGGELHFRIS